MLIPDNFELDVHDLCAIILATHAHIDPPFPYGLLLEVNKGNKPIHSIPPDDVPSDWRAFHDQPRVAYTLHPNCEAAGITTIDDYAWPGGVITPDEQTLTRRELEDAFWRCKTFKNGFILAEVACRVLDRLPRTTILRAKTSSGQQVTCATRDIKIMNMLLSPHESCLMVERQMYFSGFGDDIPWVVLLLGDPRGDRVVVDLALSQIGGRGLGNELFALVKQRDYTEKLLPKYAVRDPDEDRETYMFNPWSMTAAQENRVQLLVGHILTRLAKVSRGENNFCRYCGKDDVNMRCSKCKKANFCPSCVELGWKYHKVWCL